MGGLTDALRAAKECLAHVCTGDTMRCMDGNGCECEMAGSAPTDPMIALRNLVAALSAQPRPSADRQAIRMLVAAGFVAEAKANEALNIAHGFTRGELQPQPASAPVGVEGLDAAAVEAGHITFESMKQCADAWLAVVDALNTAAPGWSEKKGTGRECATAAIAALAQQPAGMRQSLKLAAAEEQAEAWQAVCELLTEIRPGWAVQPKSGVDCALGTIRAIAQQPAVHDASTALRSIYDLLGVNTESDAGAEIARLHIIEAKSKQPAAVDEAMVERALNARYNGYDVACYLDEKADGRGVLHAALTAALAQPQGEK